MNEELKSEAPPAQNELPQGAQAFLQAHKACYDAIQELFAPYVQRHPGVARNFEQVMAKMREVGFWTNDALNMMMRPELQPAAEKGKPDAEAAQE